MEVKSVTGPSFQIDKEDLHLALSHRWYFDGRYIFSTISRKKVYLHRLIMSPGKMQVDHINDDKLDNRRSNLQLVTNAQNMQKAKRKKPKSGYRGVSFNCGGWRFEIWSKMKRTRVGGFRTAKDAAIAYNKMAQELHGRFAVLNDVKENK